MNFEELCSFIKIRSSSTYCEGDGQVDLISNVGHISLPEETGQADLGTIYREKKNNQSKQSMTFTVNQHLGIFYSPLLLVPKGIHHKEGGKKRVVSVC